MGRLNAIAVISTAAILFMILSGCAAPGKERGPESICPGKESRAEAPDTLRLHNEKIKP